MNSPRLVLVCGLPGSGKTTLARLVADKYGALRLCPDEWMAALGIDLYDETTREKLEARFWSLAQELLRLGQSVILESGFWLHSDREEKRLTARSMGVAVELRYLDVPLDELWIRIERRNVNGGWGTVPIERADLEKWAKLFEGPSPEEQANYDTPVPSDKHRES